MVTIVSISVHDAKCFVKSDQRMVLHQSSVLAVLEGVILYTTVHVCQQRPRRDVAVTEGPTRIGLVWRGDAWKETETPSHWTFADP